MQLRLKKFDMSSIANDKVVVLIGKRDTGKSFLCRDLLYHHQKIPVGTVISATEAANSFYSEMVPPLFIHNEYSDEIIQKVLERQQKLIEHSKKGGPPIDLSAFLILDDCLYDNSWTRSKYIRSCFLNGRHYKLLFILAMQYALGIPPALRTNVDYVFILRENIVQNRRRLYESFAGVFPNFDVFCTVMDQCTENYECIVIANNAKSNKIEDQVFWYKAEPHPPFKLGSEKVWDYSRKFYNGGNSEIQQYDPKAFRKNTNKTVLDVKKYNSIL